MLGTRLGINFESYSLGRWLPDALEEVGVIATNTARLRAHECG